MKISFTVIFSREEWGGGKGMGRKVEGQREGAGKLAYKIIVFFSGKRLPGEGEMVLATL